MWIFSIFPVLFFWFFFLFYFNRTCICDGDSSFAVQFVPRETLMRQKCVHESFTRNKGQVWVWARSSLRKLERKLDHMELRLNFLVEKASWGPRGSPHKKVARSFSPSKYSSCKTSQSQLRNQSSSWKKPHEQLMKKWANFLVKKKITHSKPHEVLMRNQVPRGKSLMRSSWKIGFLMRTSWGSGPISSWKAIPHEETHEELKSSWGNLWGTKIPHENPHEEFCISWGTHEETHE